MSWCVIWSIHYFSQISNAFFLYGTFFLRKSTVFNVSMLNEDAFQIWIFVLESTKMFYDII